MRKNIPIEEEFARWRQSPTYLSELDDAEAEFDLMDALVGARTRAGLTQAEVAERMGTSQAAVARMEGGRVKPSLRSLERYAAATGHKLRFAFEPATATEDMQAAE